ncbi:MAG: glycosyltransferase [Ignavibacteria bacterium]
MRKLKILLTLNNSLISGIENFVLELIRNSDRNKYEFSVAVPCYGQIVEVLKELGIKYYIFNDNCVKPYNLKGIINIFKILSKNKFDIVHAQAGIAPCLLGSLTGVRMKIEHKHGLDFTEEERKNMGFLKVRYESIKKYLVDYTISGNERDIFYLVDKFGYNREKVKLVYNGVKDIYGLAERERTEETEETVIGTVCRLTYQKAPENFVEIAKIIEESGTGKNIRYEIWGTGELQEKLENLIAKYGLEKKVFLMGYMHDKIKTFGNFDIFVLTSRYEGIPYVLLDSMSAGVPVIATDVGGKSEVIETGRNGILLPRNEIKLMADKIMKLIDDEDLRKRFAAEAYKDFRNKWTIEKTIPRMLEVYDLIK